MVDKRHYEITQKVWKTDIKYDREAVMSWEGYGNTMGALHKQKLPRRLTDRHVALLRDYLRGHITEQELFEVTHKIALEQIHES